MQTNRIWLWWMFKKLLRKWDFMSWDKKIGIFKERVLFLAMGCTMDLIGWPELWNQINESLLKCFFFSCSQFIIINNILLKIYFFFFFFFCYFTMIFKIKNNYLFFSDSNRKFIYFSLSENNIKKKKKLFL